MVKAVFQPGDEFIDRQWDEEGEHCLILAVNVGFSAQLYEVKWGDGAITYERADYLRQLEKI
jgi:hypothetical protein